METDNTQLHIGILTHYYNSINYGGNLQAYALCAVLQDMGHMAEQISYDKREDPLFWGADRSGKFRDNKNLLKKIYRQTVLHWKTAWKNRSIAEMLEQRAQAIKRFNQNSIPHSDRYTFTTISDCVDSYDLLITGSDQVWHPHAVCAAYLLEFADGKVVPKISYAASIASEELSEDQLARYQKSLGDFQAISVREQNAVSMFAPVLQQHVVQVLDPTLLLSSEQWDRIAAPERPAGKYVFCYFLGDSDQSRHLASEYALKYGVKILTLPHLQGKYRKCDQDFGDEQLFAVSPEEYISLIKHAECIFTDSFHAVVFSLIYHKEFFVFRRGTVQSMESRLYSLMDLFDLQERFCDTSDKVKAEYLCNQKKIDYSGPFPKFEAKKESSLSFLRVNLDCANRKRKKYET